MESGDWTDRGQERLRELRRRERREEVRRRRRRRRVAALSTLGAVVLVVAILAVTAFGGSGGSAAGHSASAGRGGAREHSGARGQTSGHGGHRHGAATGGEAAEGISDGLPEPPRDVAVPILMYHVINPPPAGAPFPGLYVPAPEFAEQMQALKQAGFHAVTLDQLWRHWKSGAPLPGGKPVVLSFDNGYQSQYTNALPVLRKLGWKGVENIQLSGLPPSQGGLSQSQVRGLIAAGWELDTQGYSHAELTTLTPSELRFQVAQTRIALQRRYHVPVRWFCYPSGHYNAAVLEEVKAAGYIGSTTVVPGWAKPGEDPYMLPRLRVLRGTSGAQLVELIEATKEDPAPPAAYE